MTESSDQQAALTVNNIRCEFNKTPVFSELSFSIPTNGSACLLGPSGCGKTTALRAIAGFEPVVSGEIHLGDRPLNKKGISVPPEKRRVGMVFQDYALFPHLTLAENVAFGINHLDKPKQKAIVTKMLTLVGLVDRASHYPHQISGGQQQRVALARAIAPGPDLLLLDEPFSNLDADLRQNLNLEVKRILKSQNMPYLLVTHDQHEAFAMAERVGVMFDGKIQQWDTPFNLYHRPTNPIVANFIGDGVLLPGTVNDSNSIHTAAGELKSSKPLAQLPGKQVQVLLRPDDIIPESASPHRATVEDKAFKGAVTLYHLKLSSGELIKGLFSSHHDYAVGETIGYGFELDHLVCFPL